MLFEVLLNVPSPHVSLPPPPFTTFAPSHRASHLLRLSCRLSAPALSPFFSSPRNSLPSSPPPHPPTRPRRSCPYLTIHRRAPVFFVRFFRNQPLSVQSNHVIHPLDREDRANALLSRGVSAVSLAVANGGCKNIPSAPIAAADTTNLPRLCRLGNNDASLATRLLRDSRRDFRLAKV